MANNITLKDDDAALVIQLLQEHNIHSIPCGIVTFQPKIIIRNQLIFSKCLKRVKKRNSYTVAFFQPHSRNQLCYGRVDKFLTCPADTANCLHIAIIEQLKTESCQELQLTYPPELQCVAPLLCSDFISILNEPCEKVAIPIECIFYKCFDISTCAYSGLTTLVNENELTK